MDEIKILEAKRALLKEYGERAELSDNEFLAMLEVEYAEGRLTKEEYLKAKMHLETAKHAAQEMQRDMPAPKH